MTTQATDVELRERALRQLKKKRDFVAHLVTYVLVNAFVLIIWATTGSGFFWPIFPIAGWGIGLAFHAWDVYYHEEPTEEDIQREMARLR
ncbi:MAG TPA: 2TM domain-containing protein [Dehalococcoidia bacterium]